MKNKIIYTIFLVIILNVFSFAYANVKPYYINSLRRCGIGLTLVNSPVVLKKSPKGEISEIVNFDFKTGETTCLVNKNMCSQDEVFATFSEDKKLAFLTTLDETEKNAFVCFNQSQNPVCGWVEEDSNNKFYGWVDLIDYWGKKYGLYLFKDIQKSDKLLYSAPVKQTNSTGVLELPKYISPWLVNGNWVLVKVHDFNNQMKTGWLNYRDNSGKLKLFVNF